MEYAATFTADGWVDVERLPQRLRSTADSSAPAQVPEELLSGPLLPTLEELQRSYVRHVLEQTGGNKRRAAALLGIGRRTLRSEEHTSELQSRGHLVCRLLLEKKKKQTRR